VAREVLYDAIAQKADRRRPWRSARAKVESAGV